LCILTEGLSLQLVKSLHFKLCGNDVW